MKPYFLRILFIGGLALLAVPSPADEGLATGASSRLMERLNHPSPMVREQVAAALAEQKEVDAVPALRAAMEREANPAARKAMERAIEVLAPPPEQVEQKQESLRPLTAEELARRRQSLQQHLPRLDDLEKDWQEKRRQAAESRDRMTSAVMRSMGDVTVLQWDEMLDRLRRQRLAIELEIAEIESKPGGR